MNFILSQLCLAAGLRIATQTTSPVEKVVELINELKAKIEADAALEQKIYDKYACWCESTTQRKADSIDAGKASIGTSTTKILMHKGTIATRESEIAGLNAEIDTNEQAMKKLTGIRESENSDYQSQKDYMETTLSSLHKAIGVLDGAGTGKGDMALLRVASKVRTAILDAPQLDLLSEKSSRMLKSFLEDPPSFMQGGSPYTSQSSTITGILKDMYDTFGADLEKSNQEESDAQKAFEDEIAAKTAANKLAHEGIVMKETEKADEEKLLNEEQLKLESTQEQLKLDEDIFSETRTACKEKSDEWDARCLARTEQMVGVNKALEILTSDSARSTFQSAGTRPVDTFGSEGVEGLSFVQTEEEDNSPREQAFRAIQKAIGNSHDLKLARLAAEVRSTAKGHFDTVIASLDEQLQALKDEAADDVTQRDWCVAEQTKEERNKSDQEYLISQLEAKIARAKKKRAKLVKEKEETEQAKADLTAMYNEATADRTAESAAYETAKADDVTAIGLLGDAIAAFSSYGENQAFLQVDKKHTKRHTKRARKQPVFEVSEDQAPEASFNDDRAGAQNSIIDLMKNIKEGLESEVSIATKAEAKAVHEFEALTNSTNAQHAAYDTEITELDGSISSTDEDIEDLGERKTDTESELSATVDYLKRIEPNCEWIKGAFTKRAEAREKESHGLMEAKSILSGGSLGFLQSKREPLLPVH